MNIKTKYQHKSKHRCERKYEYTQCNCFIGPVFWKVSKIEMPRVVLNRLSRKTKTTEMNTVSNAAVIQKLIPVAVSDPWYRLVQNIPAISPPDPRDTMKQSSMTWTMIKSFWKVFNRIDTYRGKVKEIRREWKRVRERREKAIELNSSHAKNKNWEFIVELLLFISQVLSHSYCSGNTIVCRLKVYAYLRTNCIWPPGSATCPKKALRAALL